MKRLRLNNDAGMVLWFRGDDGDGMSNPAGASGWGDSVCTFGNYRLC
jgi:hypothetical protein